MDIPKWHERYCKDARLKYPSRATQKTYASCVGVFLAHFRNEVDPQHVGVDDIKTWLLQSESFPTRNHRLCAIKSFYEITVGMPLKLDKIPFAKKEKKLPRINDMTEVVKKIDGIKNTKHKAMLTIGRVGALRVSEIVNMKISDVDGKKKIVLLRQAKGNKDRYIGISEKVLMLLREYWKEFKPKDYLFEGQ